MRTWSLVVLVACGSPPAPATVSNTAQKLPVGRSDITGTVTDSTTKEPLAGATIVVNDVKDAVAITDENGKFSISLARPGLFRVTFYYLEITVGRDVAVEGPTKVDQELDQGWAQRGGANVICRGPRASDCRTKP